MGLYLYIEQVIMTIIKSNYFYLLQWRNLVYDGNIRKFNFRQLDIFKFYS